MRYTNLLPLAATLAAAVVIPDDATAQKLSLDVERLVGDAGETVMGWWDTLQQTAQKEEMELKKSIEAIVQGRLDTTSSKIAGTVGFVKERAQDYLNSILYVNQPDADADESDGKPDHGHHGRHGHRGSFNATKLTVYQAIQQSNYTKKFAALINDFPDVIELLNSTDTNVTLFVPVDKAFEKIPEHHGKPPKEIIQKIIEYHIVPGYYPVGRVVTSPTIPTALKTEALGGRPQRLRVSLNIFGIRLNFYGRVAWANLFTNNGVIHAVNTILVPPAPVRRRISLFPSEYSTLELAAAKTGLLPHHEDDKHHGEGGGDDDDKARHHHQLTGLTVFAPTNAAFSRLGRPANAFLFNTERGLHYLRALLKYHIVANHTLYSNAYYGIEGKSEELFPSPSDAAFDIITPRTPEEADAYDKLVPSMGGENRNGHFHVDLPTLLDDRSLSIDIARWYAFINVRINGYQNVAVQDDVAWDGVIQSMHSVIIPPRQAKEGEEQQWESAQREISVEELVERLQPYVDEDAANQDTTENKDEVWGEL